MGGGGFPPPAPTPTPSPTPLPLYEKGLKREHDYEKVFLRAASVKALYLLLVEGVEEQNENVL